MGAEIGRERGSGRMGEEARFGRDGEEARFGREEIGGGAEWIGLAVCAVDAWPVLGFCW